MVKKIIKILKKYIFNIWLLIIDIFNIIFIKKKINKNFNKNMYNI